MASELTEITRWQARIGQAAAVGTVPWQHASLAVGLVGLATIALWAAELSPIVCLTLLALHAALLAGGLWLSLRLRIDAVLFQALAQAESIDSFDQAMVELAMLSSEKAGRPVPDRVAGLMRLVRLLALSVATQLVLLVAGGWLAWR